MGFLSDDEIKSMGFHFIGKNVLLSDKASFYNCANISINSNSRIDDFCLISAGIGGIEIGKNVHVAVYSLLIGAGKITLSDYSCLSSRVSIYSSSDNSSGTCMTNPTVPKNFTNVFHADVFLGRHVIVSSTSVLLPGITIHDGAVIGSMSLVKKDCDSFFVYAGCPAKKIKERDKGLLELEKTYEMQLAT